MSEKSNNKESGLIFYVLSFYFHANSFLLYFTKVSAHDRLGIFLRRIKRSFMMESLKSTGLEHNMT